MKYIIHIFFWLLTIQYSTGQLDTTHFSRINNIMEKLYKEGKIHGGVLIAEGENIIYQNAFGMADRTLEIPNTTKTRFVINSMEKMFTAILTLQLVEDDLISLHDPVSKHIPWFKHPRAGDITIHQLLSHRSGLKDYFGEQLNGTLDFFIPQREVLDKMAQLELNFEPDTGYDYCNTGFLLLGEIIMKYYNDDLYNVLQDQIYKPLDMKNTYNSTSVYGPGAPVYYRQDGSPATPFPHSNYRGDGGAKSTLEDLHKFMVALGSEKLLRPESWEIMFQKHSLPEEAFRDFGPHYFPYGYGSNIYELPHDDGDTASAIGHSGAGIGSSNIMIKFKDSNRIVILWNNEFLRPVSNELFDELSRL
jgi:CubicO group peptidase (beta-lactamase class C family)